MTPPDDVAAWMRRVADEPYAYLTTTGRVTGRPHEIEIWFAAAGTTVYLLCGDRDRADWVRNLRRDPAVGLRIAGRTVDGRARVVAPDAAEDARARRLVWSKYTSGDDLVHWRGHALPVAIDVRG